MNIGDKFRQDFHRGKRRRQDIICVKSGVDTFFEQKSKAEHVIIPNSDYECSSYDLLIRETKEQN